MIVAIATALGFTPRPAAADPIQITSGFITVTGAQDVMSRGFLRAIFYNFSTAQFRLDWAEGDGSIQTVKQALDTRPVFCLDAPAIPFRVEPAKPLV